MKKETTAREIVNMLPKGLLKELSEKYKIDYKIKKLSGEVIFLILIQALFSSTNLSLRNLDSQGPHMRLKQESEGDYWAWV